MRREIYKGTLVAIQDISRSIDPGSDLRTPAACHPNLPLLGCDATRGRGRGCSGLGRSTAVVYCLSAALSGTRRSISQRFA